MDFAQPLVLWFLPEFNKYERKAERLYKLLYAVYILY